jgi:hypothetical protein
MDTKANYTHMGEECPEEHCSVSPGTSSWQLSTLYADSTFGPRM